MIRQAHSYLVGAVSGTALVAAAVVAFVLLVSTQALRDWPLAGLGFGGGDDVGSVAPARPAASGADVPAGTATATAGGAAGGDARPAGGGGAEPGGGGGAPATTGAPTASPVAETPVSSSPGAGGGGSAPAGSGSGPASGSGGGGGNGGGSQVSAGGGGGGGGGAASSPSGTIAGTVNDTVAGVDSVTGGALGQTGVTKVTEDVVNGVAGPESTVGKTVDETVPKVKEAVGGLLGGGR